MKSNFGSNVKHFRLKKGFSLTQLAELCEASRSMLAKIEKNESIPTVLLAMRIARALNVPISKLIDEPILADTTVVTREERVLQLNPINKIATEVVMPYNAKDGVEILSFTMPPGSTTQGLPSDEKGTFEYLVINKGNFKVIVDGTTYFVKAGDCIRFSANVGREVVNISAAEAEFLCVMVYKKD
jgi:transcriptional regulator with XRE-family HTH domain